jgi:hypothetical protein
MSERYDMLIQADNAIEILEARVLDLESTLKKFPRKKDVTNRCKTNSLGMHCKTHNCSSCMYEWIKNRIGIE